MQKLQKLMPPKLQLHPSFGEELSNFQQETIKGGVFDAFTKVVQTEPNVSRIDKSSPLLAKALVSNG